MRSVVGPKWRWSLLSAAVAMLCFAALTGAVGLGALESVDHRLTRAIQSQLADWLDSAGTLLTMFGSVELMVPLTLVLGVLLWQQSGGRAPHTSSGDCLMRHDAEVATPRRGRVGKARAPRCTDRSAKSARAYRPCSPVTSQLPVSEEVSR